MAYESALHFVANLILFALLLVYWCRLVRPRWVSAATVLTLTALFLSCQGVGLVWSAMRLGPSAFTHPYLSTMSLVVIIVLVNLVLERLMSKGGTAAFALIPAFIIHSYVILYLPYPSATALQISPFVRSPWYLFHLFSALIAYGAYTCAAGGAVGYFVGELVTRSRFAPVLPASPDCLNFTRRALVIGFPWLSASLVTGAIWTHMAWGSYWSWHPWSVWLLILWLILTMTLHARNMPRWQGTPLAAVSLLGFILAIASLPLAGQPAPPAW